MSGGGQQPVTTTNQTNTPWGPVAGGFSQTIPIAESMQASGVGYQPYTGPVLGAVDPMQQQGEQHAETLAGWNPYGDPSITSALSLANTMQQNQGLTPGIQGAISGLGNVASNYSALGSQMQGIAVDPRTVGAYENVINNMGTQNPYLQQELQSTIGNQINSSMAGAGRYGSGAHQEAIAAGEAPALAQDWATRQQMGLGAAGGLTNQLMGGAQGAMAANQGFGAAQGAIADLYGQGLGRAGQWAQLAPTLQQAQYFPSQVEQQIGNYYTGRNQQALQGQIQQYNAQQAYPWEQLARENAIIGGAGGLGGTTTGTSTTSVPLAQRLLGGGLAGAGLGSAFGPMGAGIGALGGAGLGFL